MTREEDLRAVVVIAQIMSKIGRIWRLHLTVVADLPAGDLPTVVLIREEGRDRHYEIHVSVYDPGSDPRTATIATDCGIACTTLVSVGRMDDCGDGIVREIYRAEAIVPKPDGMHVETRFVCLGFEGRWTSRRTSNALMSAIRRGIGRRLGLAEEAAEIEEQRVQAERRRQMEERSKPIELAPEDEEAIDDLLR